MLLRDWIMAVLGGPSWFLPSVLKVVQTAGPLGARGSCSGVKDQRNMDPLVFVDFFCEFIRC